MCAAELDTEAPGQVTGRQLHFVIVGAGLGGLTAAIALRRAGQRVTVLEQSQLAREHGAAIGVPPNANGLLHHLGIDPAAAGAVELKLVTGYDKSGESVAQPDMSTLSRGWQHPYLLAHRVDLHSQLKSAATSRDGVGTPVDLRTNSRVVTVDPEAATVTLVDGRSIAADVVIGADGVHSVTRRALTAVTPYPSGKSAYRFLLRRSDALRDPIVRATLNHEGEFVFWFDSDRRVVLYPTRNNEIWNLVCIHPDRQWDEEEDVWNKSGLLEDLLSAYDGFDECALALMRLADETTLKIWRLMDMDPVPAWCSQRLTLLGDAAHPFLPYQGQGGAQAMEDAVSLGILFPVGVNCSEIVPRLLLYQECRKARAEKVQELTRIAGDDTVSPTEEKLTTITTIQQYICNYDERENSRQQLLQWMKAREAI